MDTRGIIHTGGGSAVVEVRLFASGESRQAKTLVPLGCKEACQETRDQSDESRAV